jgi:hypothetical protein
MFICFFEADHGLAAGYRMGGEPVTISYHGKLKGTIYPAYPDILLLYS